MKFIKNSQEELYNIKSKDKQRVKLMTEKSLRDKRRK